MEKVETRKIAQLERDNYDIWSIRMEERLKKMKVWYLVSNIGIKTTELEKIKDKTDQYLDDEITGCSEIIENISDFNVQFIRGNNTTKERWDVLRNIHQGASAGNKLLNMRKLIKPPI
jgi:hypothetical protein